MTTTPTEESRLLVIGDLKRMGPIVANYFAPQRIDGVHSYLEGIAEVPRARTRAVLVCFDPTCRDFDSAVRALRGVAGSVPLVCCCEPADESAVRRALQAGLDDYVIFPPDAEELERSLKVPSRRTQTRWLAAPPAAPAPSIEELARMSDVLPRLAAADPGALDAMAALVQCALKAEHAEIVLEGRTGAAGAAVSPLDAAALIEPITLGAQTIGQIRVGPSRAGGFTHEDTARLRHYGVLFGRLLDGAKKAAHWRRMAMTDDLTGLPNRRRLLEFLEEKLAVAERTRTTVTALVFDIDDFKRYNDTYGHEAGDEILRETGRLFVKCSRQTDMVARYGGDEFVVVFWAPEGPRTLGSQHPQEIIEVVKRFRDALRSHRFSRLGPEATGCLTISGGLAHFPWQARTPLELIAAADRALLQAKEGGKNRFWVVGDGPVSE